jgi:hypothetical protein
MATATKKDESEPKTGYAPVTHAPGTEPTQEQLDNPDSVEVEKDPNDPNLAGNPAGQADRDAKTAESKSKPKTRTFKVPAQASSEHFAAEVKENTVGVTVVVFHKHGYVGDDYEIAASQLDELVELLSGL